MIFHEEKSQRPENGPFDFLMTCCMAYNDWFQMMCSKKDVDFGEKRVRKHIIFKTLT